MKSGFPEFYQPSAEELDALWREGTIVLDTNVLLDMYALPKDGREALLGLFRELKDRIWIPHQVGLEFQRHRLRSIASERDRTSKALDKAKSSINGLVSHIRDLELHKRGIDVDEDEIIQVLEHARDATCEALKKAHRVQLSPGMTDPIRDQLDQILQGRLGEAFKTQSELEAIFNEGRDRYAKRIPPGFEDDAKDGETFSHAGLVYQSKFGDLLLWKQLLAHAKRNQIGRVVFVTLEKKEDWWVSRDNNIMGPRPELLRELTNEGGVLTGWIVRLPDFMSQINDHLAKKISSEALGQVAAADAARSDQVDLYEAMTSTLRSFPEHHVPSQQTSVVDAVQSWMRHAGFQILPQPPGGGAYDIAAIRPTGEFVGFDVLAFSTQLDRAHIEDISVRLAALKQRSVARGKAEVGLIVSSFARGAIDTTRFDEPDLVRQAVAAYCQSYEIELIIGVFTGDVFFVTYRNQFGRIPLQ